MQKKQKIISIAGTTASGKSALAVALAKKINAEIISADSRQIYKDFNIGTAKITQDEMGGIKHYLIDEITPNSEYSAGIFVEQASAIIKEITKRGKVPIITGGTGLYLGMLLDGFDMPQSEPDEKLRVELNEKLEKFGIEFLYEELKQLDLEFAQKIHPNDTYKIMRSIEILRHSKTNMSEARGKCESKYDVLKIVLSASDRQFIYDRINARVDKMFEQGLEKEVKYLFEKYPNSQALFNTIGYQEFIPYFENKCSLTAVSEKINQNTRRYAKRQLTWFRKQENVNWINVDELSFNEILEHSMGLFNQFMC